MPDADPGPDLVAGPDLEAAYASWLSGLQAAVRGEQDSDVPCGTCTACCSSSQFVHIGPDETDTLAHIPRAVRFPAPGLPAGHVLLGYDDQGRCPMLAAHGCSIYEHRPRTCRTYDCRIFPATAVTLEADKPLIADRVRRWRFTLDSDEDRRRQAAVHRAATFLREHADDLPDEVAPATATQRAILAIEVHDLFLPPDGVDHGDGEPARPDVALVARALVQRTRRRGAS